MSLTSAASGFNQIKHRTVTILAVLVAFLAAFASSALADETCNSPYMAKLIKGQEDYIYVWTLGGDQLGFRWLANRGASHGIHR
jgi:hypothetical protein